MAKTSLDVRLQQYSQWSVVFPAVSAQETPRPRAAGRSRSPTALPARLGAVRHCIVPMATFSDESDFSAHQYLAGTSDYSLVSDLRSDVVPLSSSDMQFLVSSSALPPIPCLVGWGSGVLFRSSVLREKAVFELQP
jgi:hypothetical protein